MQELMQMRRGRGKNNEGKKVQMDPETQLKVSRDVRWQMHAWIMMHHACMMDMSMIINYSIWDISYHICMYVWWWLFVGLHGWQVAIATAAKAKVLLRELKRVKADLDSAKKRCSELEEENKMLRDGDHPAHAHDDDDDMVCMYVCILI